MQKRAIDSEWLPMDLACLMSNQRSDTSNGWWVLASGKGLLESTGGVKKTSGERILYYSSVPWAAVLR